MLDFLRLQVEDRQKHHLTAHLLYWNLGFQRFVAQQMGRNWVVVERQRDRREREEEPHYWNQVQQKDQRRELAEGCYPKMDSRVQVFELPQPLVHLQKDH